MKVIAIDNNISASNNRTFKAKPDGMAMEVYKRSIQEGLELLHKRLDVIIHNSAAPSIPKENTGIGSLFSTTSQKLLFPFLKTHGITGIQQEPNNLRKKGDPSPYVSKTSGGNIFMIPLEKLTTKEYDSILPRKIFDDIVLNVPKNSDNVPYEYVTNRYNSALQTAYNIFIKNNNTLNEEFKEFKEQNIDKMEKDAIFDTLCNIYDKYWAEWNDIDKNLYAPRNQSEQQAASKRIAEIKTKYADKIDFYLFKQFLINKEIINSNKLEKAEGINIIGDSPVANPESVEWAYQNLFLEGKAIGAPPDFFTPDGQRWGFKYFNPKYIFNPDGSLGTAGKLLKAKYDSYFSMFSGGLRIDHVIGLVDPFIYSVDAKKMTPLNSGRIYSMEGEFKKTPEEYSNILKEIVLQSAQEHGIDKTNLICEDLGDPNPPTQKVMKDLDLSGIAVTQFVYRGKDTPENYVIMLGSHDNQSLLEYTQNFFKKVEGKNINPHNLAKKISDYFHQILRIGSDENLAHFLQKTELLAQDTAPHNATKEEIRDYTQKLRTDKRSFIEASFAELFTSPARRVQIFFSDFWGLGKTYNRPGTSKGNWTLRIPSYFEKQYYEAVSKGDAPNMPRIIATALRHRGLDVGNETLMRDLDNSAKILDK